ncbi:polyphosphate kinase 2 family protein [Mucilaginibacter ginsenosidivorax]|nr:hypothetical protein [Mucilaginibacter ginsenosidivorax]
MSNIVKKFKVENGKGFKLGDFDPAYSDGFKKIEARKTLKDLIDETFDLQTELYAANKYALLIIFQAMDAAGKDSAIEHTLSGLNPQGCQVYSFKQPSTEDY